MNETNGYKYLAPRSGSAYKTWFVKGRKLRADVLRGETEGEDARTPEKVAEDFGVPAEAVYEAIRWCGEHPEALREDYERDHESIRRHGFDKPPLVPPGYRSDE